MCLLYLLDCVRVTVTVDTHVLFSIKDVVNEQEALLSYSPSNVGGLKLSLKNHREQLASDRPAYVEVLVR